jgi:hypothetical protein
MEDSAGMLEMTITQKSKLFHLSLKNSFLKAYILTRSSTRKIDKINLSIKSNIFIVDVEKS